MLRRGFIGTIAAAFVGLLGFIGIGTGNASAVGYRSNKGKVKATPLTGRPGVQIEQVQVRRDGGVNGDDMQDCSLTYSVYEMGTFSAVQGPAQGFTVDYLKSKLLGEKKRPARGRFPKTQYDPGTWGVLTTLPCGKKLLDVYDEMPAIATC